MIHIHKQFILYNDLITWPLVTWKFGIFIYITIHVSKVGDNHYVSDLGKFMLTYLRWTYKKSAKFHEALANECQTCLHIYCTNRCIHTPSTLSNWWTGYNLRLLTALCWWFTNVPQLWASLLLLLSEFVLYIQ